MNIEYNVPLHTFTSLHVGGAADVFIRVRTDDDVAAALQFCHAKCQPYFILGKGSNTLFPDTGFRGVVIHMEDRSLAVDGQTVTASSGVFMRPLIQFCLDHSLVGLEELAGIPGTVGGAVRGNAGTWQTEIKHKLAAVEIFEYDMHGTVTKKVLSNQECAFGYRDSIFKKKRNWIILRATFALTAGSPREGQARVAKDLEDRHARQPYDAPSAGSIFKNPNPQEQLFAGSLIEQCGLKDTRRGGAVISDKHANFILNRGQARSADVHDLITLAQTAVRQKFNIQLQPEIEIVPPQDPLTA